MSKSEVIWFLCLRKSNVDAICFSHQNNNWGSHEWTINWNTRYGWEADKKKRIIVHAKWIFSWRTMFNHAHNYRKDNIFMMHPNDDFYSLFYSLLFFFIHGGSLNYSCINFLLSCVSMETRSSLLFYHISESDQHESLSLWPTSLDLILDYDSKLVNIMWTLELIK